MAFPGFGLPGHELQKMTARTAPLMDNGMVAQAIKFAIAQEKGRPTSLASRVSLALLNELTVEPKAARQIFQLGVSDAHVEAFLQKRLGPAVWAALGEQSRKDLTEAEQKWCNSAQEFGAGRQDWGSLILLYSRPIEAEVRARVGPLLM